MLDFHMKFLLISRTGVVETAIETSRSFVLHKQQLNLQKLKAFHLWYKNFTFQILKIKLKKDGFQEIIFC